MPEVVVTRRVTSFIAVRSHPDSLCWDFHRLLPVPPWPRRHGTEGIGPEPQPAERLERRKYRRHIAPATITLPPSMFGAQRGCSVDAGVSGWRASHAADP